MCFFFENLTVKNIVGSIEYFDLFHDIKKFFDCGTVKAKSTTVIRYDLESKKSIGTVLIPFIDQHILHTEKKIHYSIFREAFFLYKQDLHKTDEGFRELLNLAYNMNKGGKRRSLSQEEYIALNASPLRQLKRLLQQKASIFSASFIRIAFF
jgi:LAGLIDADG endonuclease